MSIDTFDTQWLIQLTLSTNNKATVYNPADKKMAKQADGFVPDFPTQPVFR